MTPARWREMHDGDEILVWMAKSTHRRGNRTIWAAEAPQGRGPGTWVRAVVRWNWSYPNRQAARSAFRAEVVGRRRTVHVSALRYLQVEPFDFSAPAPEDGGST